MLEKFLIKILPIIWAMAEGAVTVLGIYHMIPLSLTLALMCGSAFITLVLYDVGTYLRALRIKEEKRIRAHKRKYRTMKSPYDPDFKMVLLDE